MTGGTLPQSVTTAFHEFCNCCEYLKLTTTELSRMSFNRVWNEYTISCEHYDACKRVHELSQKEG